MKTKCLNIVLPLIIVGVLNFEINAQEKVLKMSISKYEILDSIFAHTLDSLKLSEKKCDDYDSSLIWLISLESQSYTKHDLMITLVSGLAKPSGGYFYRNNTLYVVYGKILHRTFVNTNRARIFKFPENDLPRPEDYSTWHLNWINDKYVVKESYTLPCE